MTTPSPPGKYRIPRSRRDVVPRPALLARTSGYGRIVIGEVMGRQWRRPGDPPVFNREAHEYVELLGRELIDTIAVPYPRYRCDLTVLVFE